LQVKSKLKGHTKRITGLSFSHVLNVLVSSGADAQVIFSNIDLSSESCFSMIRLHQIEITPLDPF
jgi:WD40 repeat protein